MPKILALPALLLALTLAPAGCDVDDDGPNSPRVENPDGPDDVADTDGDDDDAGDTDTDTGEEPQCTPRVLLPPITGGGPLGECP